MSRVFLAALVMTLAGCTAGPPLPKTYPASGTVYKDGKPMTAGSVEFTTTADPLLRVVGDIDSAGAFTLRTVKDHQKADGAPEGEYRVMVQPPPQGEARGGVPGGHKGVPAITLPGTYKIEAKDSNQLKLTVPGVR